MTHVNAWLLSQRSDNTRRAYRADIEQLVTFLHDLDPDAGLYDLTAEHVNAWARTLAQTASAATVNRRIASLSSFYRWAIANGHTDRNPADATHVRREAVSSDHAAALTTDEMRALIAAARAAGPRDLLVVLVLAHAGIRVSELVNARNGDLRHERGHCTLVVTGKGNKVRRVVMPPAACELVADLDADEWLVTANDGTQMNRHQVTRVLARLQRRAGIETKVTPHVLRATMITEALDAGVSLWIVQDTAGHADSRTTRSYQRRAASLDKSPTYALAARWAS
ncbi:MAG: tyrosine-type recombinase/integrase [Rhodothermaceae bacterium]|nr:tyrosine-type recombinase/integrase [Rhodothermaceae bacterium]